MNIYIFQHDHWELAARFYSSGSTLQFMPDDFSTLGRPNNRFSRKDIELAYEKDFAIKYINNKDNCAVSSTLPVRLMEVFDEVAISAWLHQYSPLDASQINPNHCLGNVMICEGSADVSKIVNDDVIELTTLLENVQRISLGKSLSKFIGYIGHEPYWFVSTDGKIAYATREIESNSSLIPLMIPITMGNGFSSPVTVSNENQFLVRILNFINDASDENVNQPRLDPHFDNSISELALLRFDISLSDRGYEYFGAEKLGSLFPLSVLESEDLLEFLNELVSAHLSDLDYFGSIETFVLSFLKRDLVLRLFKSPYSVVDSVILKSNCHYSFSPIAMELFAGQRTSASPLGSKLDWPYPLCEAQDIDLPRICDSLSDIVDSQTLLLKISEFADQLVKIAQITAGTPTSLFSTDFVPSQIAMIENKLSRWGVLL